MKPYIYIILAFLAGAILFAGVPAVATILFPYGGGTGASSTPSGGQLLIGNASGTYTLAFPSAGSNVTITTSSGAITIACPACVVSSTAITWGAVQTFSTTTRPQSDVVYSTSSIGPILRASDGVCFRLSVATSGALSTTSSTCP